MPSYIPPPPILPPGSIVWAYARDSGGESQEQSIIQQRSEIEKFCQLYGLVLAQVFTDEAMSGRKDDRPQFQDMISLSTRGTVRPDGIVFWNYARFGRNQDDVAYYRATIRRAGIVPHSITDPIPYGRQGRVMEAMLDYANEERSAQNARDVKRSLEILISRGYNNGGGAPPKGYLVVTEILGRKRNGVLRYGHKWVPDPELWDLARQAWEMRAAGASYKAIQKATHGLLYTTTGSWNSFSQNKSYLGIGKCGDFEVADHHPALINQSTWDAVQAQRKAHTQRVRPKPRPSDSSLTD